MPLDAPAIDLTASSSATARTATASRSRPRRAPTASCAASRCKAREPGTRPDWIAFALTNSSDEQIERLLVAPHFRLVGSGVIWPDLGATAHRGHHGEPGHPARARGQRPTPTSSRSRSIPARPSPSWPSCARPNLPQLDLWEPEAYKRQAQRPDALQGHHHRHRRPAGAVPHHRLRGEGRADLPGRRGARLGGAGLCLHRFRLLPAHLLASPDDRAHLPRRRGSRAGRDAARLPVRLSEPQPLARALRPRHRVWLLVPGALVGLAVFDPPMAAGVARISIAARGGRRPHPGAPPRDARLRPRHHADPDLAAAAASGSTAAGFTVTGRSRNDLVAAGADRRPRADRHADRLHGDAARLRGRRAVAQGLHFATPSGARWRSRAPAT